MGATRVSPVTSVIKVQNTERNTQKKKRRKKQENKDFREVLKSVTHS